MALSPNLLGTLICFINGAASVYFNDGGSVENIATTNLDVAKMSQAFVVASQNAYESSEKAVSYPVPTTNEHFVYFLTRGGIRKIVIDPETVDTNPVHKKLFVGYNAVMQVIQKAQARQGKSPSESISNADLQKAETVLKQEESNLTADISDNKTDDSVNISVEKSENISDKKNETTPKPKKSKIVKETETETPEKVKKPKTKKTSDKKSTDSPAEKGEE
jgi:hypothetical protein